MTPLRVLRDRRTAALRDDPDLPVDERIRRLAVRVDHFSASTRNLFALLIVGVVLQLGAVGVAVYLDQRGQDRDAEQRRAGCRARNEERQTIVDILHLFDPTERSPRIVEAITLLRRAACPTVAWHDQRPTPTTPQPPGAIP